MFLLYDTIQGINCVVHYLNVKMKQNWLRKVMHSFEVHSNESACRKSGHLGMEQVTSTFTEPLLRTICSCIEESSSFKRKQCRIWHAGNCPRSFMDEWKEHAGDESTISNMFAKCMTSDALEPMSLTWSRNVFITWGFYTWWRKRITWVTKVNIIHVDISTCLRVDWLWSRFIVDDQNRKITIVRQCGQSSRWCPKNPLHRRQSGYSHLEIAFGVNQPCYYREYWISLSWA